MTDKKHKSEFPEFEEVWKSLEEKDKTGVYKRAREMADIGLEQLEYAFNSGYKTAKAKYDRPQGEWIKKQVTPASCTYVCSKCGTEEVILSNFCRECGADMRGDNNGKSSS